MAAVIGDFVGANISPFHNTAIPGPRTGDIAPHKHNSSPQPHRHHPPQARQTHPPPPLQKQHPSPRPATHPLSLLSEHSPPAVKASANTVQPHSLPLPAASSFSHKHSVIAFAAAVDTGGTGTSRTPTPPKSSSPALPFIPAHPESNLESDATVARTPQARDGSLAPMAPLEADPAQVASSSAVPFSASAAKSVASTADTLAAVPTPTAARPPPPTNAIPSPASDGDVIVGTTVPAGSGEAASGSVAGGAWSASTSVSSVVPSTVSPPLAYLPHPFAAPPDPDPPPQERVQKTIMIRDLHHIQTLAQLDSSAGHGPSLIGNDTSLQDLKFEISSMPIGDIIEMVAALLTKITTTNDREHDALNRNTHHQRQAHAHAESTTTDLHGSTPLSASVLAFHGKNVPAITILSYLSRIHKYCPTTYEVFLSLLVYFDRMAQQVNDLVMRQHNEREALRMVQQERAKQQSGASNRLSTGPMDATSDAHVAVRGADLTNGSSGGEDETDEELADSEDEDMTDAETKPTNEGADSACDPALPSVPTYFVVDSFNIHRLIIAGVTCASKFFSDVFYTNSRYAKVGGLPLAELNHLELQFLILNDFRLAIPIEDLEAYATMLVEFYAREVVGTRPQPAGGA